MTRVVYLHGFASGPMSGKAQFFARRFREIGRPVEIPRLDGGDFPRLTITGQLRVIGEAVGEGPVVLFGSSMGGYLAALFAARRPEAVERLVLMAPAFQFPSRFKTWHSAEEMESWKRRGTLPVFHYGYNEEMNLGYQIVEDAERYEEEPEFSQPALVFHGVQDTVVPASVSEAYAARHANVKLRLFESGHELTDVLEEMWGSTLGFLGSS